ncbi:hypothetical protein DRH14_00230 [Candidatus Shapirobacteria bacterium]|nr:MAG: hypothetical protein DRH14_00230 [Candidatus Shapirobacteria bacterium]
MKITAPLVKNIKSKSWMLSLFLFSFFFLFHSTVLADNSLSITAIPPRLEITVQPDKVITKTIKIRNESNSTRYIQTNIKDLIVNDNKGTPIQIEGLDQSTNPWASASWIQVSPSQFKLKAGQTKAVQLTVIAPKDALPGGHYAVVLHSPKNESVINQSGTAINTSVGTIVYITIPGDIHQQASVSKFSIPKFSEYGPINILTTISNSSDIHIAPIGHIAITNLFGANTANILFPTANIFPQTNRIFQTKLDKKWLFGRYKAQLQTTFGTNGQPLLATAFFWVIPWRLIILILTITALVISLVILLRHKPTKPKSTKNKTLINHKLQALRQKYKDRK